jgi:hypothetical protein
LLLLAVLVVVMTMVVEEGLVDLEQLLTLHFLLAQHIQ